MNRASNAGGITMETVPRARGDEPPAVVAGEVAAACSLRSRG